MMLEKVYIEAMFLFFVILGAFMQWHGKLPSMDSVQKLAATLNSRGGNIIVLGSMSLFFFIASIRFTYWIIGLSIDGKVDASQTLATAAFTFMTGSAFGGAFTSMVKAMTGEDTHSRAADGDKTTTSTTTVSSTTSDKGAKQ